MNKNLKTTLKFRVNITADFRQQQSAIPAKEMLMVFMVTR